MFIILAMIFKNKIERFFRKLHAANYVKTKAEKARKKLMLKSGS
jgi:hypothetical protein